VASSLPVRRIAVLAFLLLVLPALCLAAAPRNVVIFIGDGMGIGQVTAARCAASAAGQRLVLDSMPFTGLVATHPSDRLVTDSAAAGTALATGHKTVNGAISMLPDGSKLRTIFEAVEPMGKSTGIVTTDYVTGATPAVFVSHVPNRGQETEIAAQMIAGGTEVILGGGRSKFASKSAGGVRDDGRDLIREAADKGCEVITTQEGLAGARGPRVLGLFADGLVKADSKVPSLAEMTAKAIELLAGDKDGYVLMVEQALTDKFGHANDAGGVVEAVLALDEALKVALSVGKSDGSLLVIVTSDHETGGMCVKDADEKNPVFGSAWTGGSHTANMVAVYAFGPGAERFTGTHDNTDIPRIILELLGVK